MRKDLSGVETLTTGRPVKTIFKDALQRKYWVKEKGFAVVIEELQQMIVAKAKKVARYKQFRQNSLFRVNQGKFFIIWSNPADHRKDTEWIEEIRKEMEMEKSENMMIGIENLRDILRELPNWKSSGLDLVQGYWVKSFTNLHERIAEQLAHFLESGVVPSWMILGRTVLVVKDKSKGNALATTGQ